MILIVGGGAAGLAAAIAAARYGADVTILESGKRVGQKLMMTGNGKCNFTNASQKEKDYRGTDPSFGYEAARRFSTKDARALFHSVGIFTKDKNGYYYPMSEQAACVPELLGQECYRLGISMQFGHKVTEIHRQEQESEGQSDIPPINPPAYTVISEQGGNRYVWNAEKVILACGGETYQKTGSDGSGYRLARMCGHTVRPTFAALTALEANTCGKKLLRNFFTDTAGVRVTAKVWTYGSDSCVYSETGELQLTDYGISGIPVFCISRYVCERLKNGLAAEVAIDFTPHMPEDTFADHLRSEAHQKELSTVEKILWGFLPRKLADALLFSCGIRPEMKAGRLEEHDFARIARAVKHFIVPVKVPHEPEQAQVTAGGVNTDEVNRETMESRLIPGLYFCGEMLDVDGTCGGYNLHFAWASGTLAGQDAAQKENSCMPGSAEQNFPGGKL